MNDTNFLRLARRVSEAEEAAERYLLKSGGAVTGDLTINGIARLPPQPYVYVRNADTVSVTVGYNKLTCFTNKLADNQNCWNTSTHRLTAPVKGRYMFIVGGRWDTASVSENPQYAYVPYKNGMQTQVIGGGILGKNDTPTSTGVLTLDLEVGDYVEMYFYAPVNMVATYTNYLGLFMQIVFLG